MMEKSTWIPCKEQYSKKLIESFIHYLSRRHHGNIRSTGALLTGQQEERLTLTLTANWEPWASLLSYKMVIMVPVSQGCVIGVK